MFKRVEKSDVHLPTWENLLPSTRPVLLAFAMRQLHRRGIARDLAEDVVQSTCLVAWRKKQQFQGELDCHALVSWLTVIAKGEIENLRRSMTRGIASGQKSLEDLLETPMEPCAPSDFSDSSGSRDFLLILIVERAMGCLRPRARNLLKQHFYEGVPLGQLAAERSVSVVAIRKRIGRSLKRLGIIIRRIVRGLTP